MLRVLVRCVPSEANVTLAVTIAGKTKTMNRAQAEPVSKVLQRLQLQLQGQAQTYCPIHGVVNAEGHAHGSASPSPSVQLLSPQGQPVPSDTPNSQAWCDGAVLVLAEERHVVAVNVPTITNMTLVAMPLVDFEVVPNLKLEFGDLKHCRWQWYRLSSAPSPKGKKAQAAPVADAEVLVCEAPSYTPTIGDVGYFLKAVCTPFSVSGCEGLPFTAFTTNPIAEGPSDWPFDARVPPNPNAPNQCRLVTYNVLADVYCDTDFARTNLYPFCEPQFLKVDYRKQLLTKEVRGYQPDVVCLQEMEQRQFEDHWLPYLAKDGLQGLFCRKQSKQPMGCALFYRNSKWTLTAEHRIDLTSAWRQYPEITALCDEEPSIGRGLEVSTTVAQVVILASELHSKRLCVVNTHLFGHPKAPHIRLLQLYVLLKEVEKITGNEVPVAIAGDFNSQPFEGAHALIQRGSIGEDALDWKVGAGWRPIETKEERQEAWFQPESPVAIGDKYPKVALTHSATLSSACSNVEISYLNATADFVVDYIYHSQDRIKVLQSYPGFSQNLLRQDVAIPSSTFGSDHISLVVDLESVV